MTNKYYLVDLDIYEDIPFGEILVDKILTESKISFARSIDKEEFQRDPQNWRQEARHWIWSVGEDVQRRIRESTCLEIQVGHTVDNVTFRFSGDTRDTWSSSGWITDIEMIRE